MPAHSFEYDFVISYAGEDTAIADQLNSKLKEGKASVFYAPENLAQIWGSNLYETLARIYSKQGLFCILLVSKNYVEKQWTRHEWRSAQERAIGEIDTAYILPIRLDDAELPGLASTIGYLDFQKFDVDEIAAIALQKLKLHIDKAEVENYRKPLESKPWEYITTSDQRSQFLRENNYLDRKSADFARNSWTTRLFNYLEEKQANQFFTLVANPVPYNLNLDLEVITQMYNLEDHSPVIRSSTPSEYEWQWFSLSHMDYRQSGQSEFVRYKAHNQTLEVKPTLFIRFEESGCLEYANASGSGHKIKRQDGEEKFIFDFISILGNVWKFSNLVYYYYKQCNYEGMIQLLINITNVEGSSLGRFAREKDDRRQWPSLFDGDTFATMHFVENREGISTEPNLQFGYNLNLAHSADQSEIMEAIVEHLSQKLQRAFNYLPKERHLAPNSKLFPWWQFRINNNI